MRDNAACATEGCDNLAWAKESGLCRSCCRRAAKARADAEKAQQDAKEQRRAWDIATATTPGLIKLLEKEGWPVAWVALYKHAPNSELCFADRVIWAGSSKQSHESLSELFPRWLNKAVQTCEEKGLPAIREAPHIGAIVDELDKRCIAYFLVGITTSTPLYAGKGLVSYWPSLIRLFHRAEPRRGTERWRDNRAADWWKPDDWDPSDDA